MEIRRLLAGEPDHLAVFEAMLVIEAAADVWLAEHGNAPDRRLMLVSAALFFAGAQCGLLAAPGTLDKATVKRMLYAVQHNFTAGLEAGELALAPASKPN